MTLEQKGALLDFALAYAEYGIIPETDDEKVLMTFFYLQDKLDYDAERFKAKAEKNRRSAYIRAWKKYCIENDIDQEDTDLRDLWIDERIAEADASERDQTQANGSERKRTVAKDKDKDKDKDKKRDNIESMAVKPPARARFSPPSVEEVKAYCSENGYAVDAQRFVDYYTSNGWKVGKNPMKDWKAAVRTWSRGARREEVGDAGKYQDLPGVTYV